MAVQDFITDYTKVSYTNVGDLAWRLRLNTNFSLAVEDSDAASVFANLHIPLMNTFEEGSLVRGRIASDVSGKSYIGTSELLSTYVSDSTSNIFPVAQNLAAGVESSGQGTPVLGRRVEALFIPQGGTYDYLREVMFSSKELYTLTSADPTIGGQFLADLLNTSVFDLTLLSNVVAGAPAAGQIGLTLTNQSAVDSTLHISNNTGSDINLILSKET